MDSKKIKRMTPKEFRELGLLQEVNRQFLHPIGLALETVIEDDESEHFGSVWNYLDDPEGMAFGTVDTTSEEAKNRIKKAETVKTMFEAKRKAREEQLGWHIQPIEDMVKAP